MALLDENFSNPRNTHFAVFTTLLLEELKGVNVTQAQRQIITQHVFDLVAYAISQANNVNYSSAMLYAAECVTTDFVNLSELRLEE